jgi:hypothetical protein
VGVRGQASGTSGVGVQASGDVGVQAITSSPTGLAVVGVATSTTGSTRGVRGSSSSTEFGIGVEGAAGSVSGYGGYFSNSRGTALYVQGPASPSTARVISSSTGAYLSAGGAWVNRSDATSKENFEPIDARELLEKLSRLPISSWNYKAEGSDVRHVGPTAQDFETAFGLGGDGKAISTIDPSGIALAAIQALQSQLHATAAELDATKKRLAELESLLRPAGLESSASDRGREHGAAETEAALRVERVGQGAEGKP